MSKFESGKNRNLDSAPVISSRVKHAVGILLTTGLIFSASSAVAGCISGDCENGRGTKTWETGHRYTGPHENGLRKGCNGQMEYPNGDMYKGCWKDGKWEGFGKLVYSNGSIYEGNWHNNQRKGHGKLTFADGRIYEGEWQDGQMHGQGTEYYPNGSYHVGNWFKGKKDGKVRFFAYSDDDTATLQKWSNGKYIGYWDEDNNFITAEEAKRRHAKQEREVERMRQQRRRQRRGNSSSSDSPSSPSDHSVKPWNNLGDNCGLCYPSGRSLCAHWDSTSEQYMAQGGAGLYGTSDNSAYEAALDACQNSQ